MKNISIVFYTKVIRVKADKDEIINDFYNIIDKISQFCNEI